MADDRGVISFRHAAKHGASQLMFDLQVIAARVNYQIVLDQPGDKWCAPVRVPEVKARSGTVDYIVTNHPTPGCAFSGYPHCLLIVAMATNA